MSSINIIIMVGSINYHRKNQTNCMSYVLPSFGFFSAHIASSLSCYTQIDLSFTYNLNSKNNLEICQNQFIEPTYREFS